MPDTDGVNTPATSRPVIVVGVDGAANSDQAFRLAVAEARARHATVLAVHAWLVTNPGFPLAQPARLDAATEKILLEALHEHLATALTGQEYGQIEEKVVYGYAGRVLAQCSTDAALIVVGSRGVSAMRGALLGSVSQYVLEHAAAPVMVVHSDTAEPPKRVVVGVDGSPSSTAALQWADSYALDHKIPLVVVHAGGPPVSAFLVPGLSTSAVADWTDAATAGLATWVEEALGSQRATDVRQQVDPRPAMTALLDLIDTDDLVVVGRRGAGGVKGLLLGSVARRLAAHVPGAVVVVGGTIDGAA